MPRFSVGDILRPIDGRKCGTYGGKQNAVAIRITDINSDGNYGYVILSKEGDEVGWCSNCFKDKNLTPVVKTLNTLQVGDYIQDGDGDFMRVLAVLNQSDEDGLCLYVMSASGPKDSKYMNEVGSIWNVFDLKINNCSIEAPTPETVEELTMEEVCKALGRVVKIKK